MYKGTFFSAAAAFATAKETPKIELAPKLDLLGVPSKFIILTSISVWSKTDNPIIDGAKILFTLFTAFITPFPI